MAILLSFLVVASLQAPATDHKIITFNVQGAGTRAGQGTFVNGINDWGIMVGWYVNWKDVSHGFVRTPNGVITRFRAPLAGRLAGQGTWATDVNPDGTVVGGYFDAGNVMHGYVRAPDGSFTIIDAPDAGMGAGQGTSAADINNKGQIVGTYFDGNTQAHGFMRAPDGTITEFDVPGANELWPVTFYGLNSAGTFIGFSTDVNQVFHSWIRMANGDITLFSAEDAGIGNYQGTCAISINDDGLIAGWYIDAASSQVESRMPSRPTVALECALASNWAFRNNGLATLRPFFSRISLPLLRSSSSSLREFSQQAGYWREDSCPSKSGFHLRPDYGSPDRLGDHQFLCPHRSQLSVARVIAMVHPCSPS